MIEFAALLAYLLVYWTATGRAARRLPMPPAWNNDYGEGDPAVHVDDPYDKH